MPNTKITKKKLSNHLHYSKAIYIIGAILTVFAISLAYTTTEYHSPNERSVTIQLVDGYANIEALDEIAQTALTSAQAFDETLEEVVFYNTAYTGDSSSDYYGAMAYMTQLYAGENDVYFLNRDMMVNLYEQGYLVPLDTLSGYDAFVSAHPAAEAAVLAEYDETFDYTGETVNENYTPSGVEHVYGFSADTLTGFRTLNAYNNIGKYVVIVYASKNIDTSFAVIDQLYGLLGES